MAKLGRPKKEVILSKESRLKMLTDIILKAKRDGDIDTLIKVIPVLDKLDDRKDQSKEGKKHRQVAILPDNKRSANKEDNEDNILDEGQKT